jgi:hypothetical protein
MPSFEQDHFFLLELANIFEPLSTQHFGQDFGSIDTLLQDEPWDEHLEGPTPVAEVDSTPQNWYTQYWFDCAFAHQCADLDGYQFRDLFDYEFADDDNFSIWTGHWFDDY